MPGRADGSLTIHDFKVEEGRRREGLGRKALDLVRPHFGRIRANGVEMDAVGGAFWTSMGREGLIEAVTLVYGMTEIVTFGQPEVETPEATRTSRQADEQRKRRHDAMTGVVTSDNEGDIAQPALGTSRVTHGSTAALRRK